MGCGSKASKPILAELCSLYRNVSDHDPTYTPTETMIPSYHTHLTAECRQWWNNHLCLYKLLEHASYLASTLLGIPSLAALIVNIGNAKPCLVALSPLKVTTQGNQHENRNSPIHDALTPLSSRPCSRERQHRQTSTWNMATAVSKGLEQLPGCVVGSAVMPNAQFQV